MPAKKTQTILTVICFFLATIAKAGPYTEAGIHKDDAAFTAWATGVTVERGYVDITNPALGYASFGEPNNALYKAEGAAEDVVSLGDGGIATLTFDNMITNGDGYDFAVFENGFDIAGGGTFLELGFVEVSSNGEDFFRFDSNSLTATNEQVDGFGAIDSTNLHNLAGKHLRGYGTAFDLEELKDVNDLLDVNSVTHVRIIDVVGYVEPADFYADGIVNFIDYSIFAAAYMSEDGDGNWNQDCDIYREWIPGTPGYYDDPDGLIDIYDLQILMDKWLVENDFASCDINGHQINDPWPTPFSSSGFDLDAVGIINEKNP